MEWGWNPESVAAVGTASATAFAAIAAWIAVVELLRRRRADERRQAVLIGAWTEVDDRAFDAETGEGIVCRLHVANRSDLPVFNVQVTCDSRLGQEDQPWFRWHSLGPGVAVSKEVWETSAHDALGYPGKVLDVSFSDHANMRWRRGADGELQCVG